MAERVPRGELRPPDGRGTSREWVAERLTLERLRGIAGSRFYERGEIYHETGAVESLVVEGDSLQAVVLGSDRYRVKLRPTAEGAGFEHSCTCPIGREGAFCKHCVAAGLAARSAGSMPERPQPASVAELRAALADLDHAGLVELVAEEAARDEHLLERLRLRFAAGGEPDAASLRRAIEVAVDPPGERIAPYEWSRGIEHALDVVASLASSHPDVVVELCEHALGAVIGARWRIDDSDGHVSWLIERIERLHLEACERGGADPEALAERLLGWRLESEVEVFDGALASYAEALGERGRFRYRELARERWESVEPRRPGEQRNWDSHAIVAVMEELARADDDLDALIGVLSRDLTLPYDFLRIAEELAAGGRGEEAIEWAERGLEAFEGERQDPRLQGFLADAYAGAGRDGEALEMAWDRFADRPSLESYRLLRPFAERCEQWPRRRERAFGLLRERARRAHDSPVAAATGWHPWADHSELVRILLAEDELDAAWSEAEQGGCDQSLLLKLAERRAEEHPEDAIAVYGRWIEPTIERKRKADYAEAVALIGRIAALLTDLDRGDEIDALVGGVRTRHARKRNLIAMLDQAGLPAHEPATS